jgi:hypothetical protein
MFPREVDARRLKDSAIAGVNPYLSLNRRNRIVPRS